MPPRRNRQAIRRRVITPGYIAWDDGLLRPLLHGVVANIPRWSPTRKWVHGHRCTGCQHCVACTCRERPRELLRCAWCAPWLMDWAPPEKTPARRKITKKKPARGRTTRRPARAVL